MTNCIKHKAVERIWLVPDYSEGQLGYVWCDDPAPGAGMDPEDAVEYVRKDAHDARVAKLEQERIELAAHVERLKAPAVKLAATVENKDDLPLHKWALKCARLVADVQKAVGDAPATSLARRDAMKQLEALTLAKELVEDRQAKSVLLRLTASRREILEAHQ